MPRRQPCSMCGEIKLIGRGSLEMITCQPCRKKRRALVDSQREPAGRRNGHPGADRGVFRRSFENRDYATFFHELRNRCIVELDGCWTWQGKSKGSGYPSIRFSRKDLSVHRLSLEAKHGRSLGSQAAHHICSNRLCVNPDHLQAVTHRENTAEMLQRQAYVRRIAELEAALHQLAPDHPLLTQVKVA